MQIYSYVPQFKQDKRHFIRPKGKIITDPDAFNFEQFKNETANESTMDNEEPKSIEAFVNKKKIASKD